VRRVLFEKRIECIPFFLYLLAEKKGSAKVSPKVMFSEYVISHLGKKKYPEFSIENYI